MNRKEKDIIRAYLRAIRYASHLESRIRIVLVGDTGTGESGLYTHSVFSNHFLLQFHFEDTLRKQMPDRAVFHITHKFSLPKSYFYVIINGAMGSKAVTLNINHCVTVWTIIIGGGMY